MNKRLFLKSILMLIGIALVMSACEPKPSTDNGKQEGKKKSKIEQTIDNHIALLSKEVDWAKSQEIYNGINADIDQYIKKSRVKQDFRDAANIAYCHSMDTIMYVVLAGECKKSLHESTLYPVNKIRTSGAYANIDKSSFHNQVMEMYKEHEEMLKYIRNVRANRQSNVTLTTDYDDGYEKEQKTKATNYLKKNYQCKDIQNGLESIKNGNAFKERRKNYCKQLVELYLQQGDWNGRDERNLKGKLNNTYFSSHPTDEDVIQWNDQIEEFKESHRGKVY